MRNSTLLQLLWLTVKLADPNMGLGTQNYGCYSTNSVYQSHNFLASVGTCMFVTTITIPRNRICIMAQMNAVHKPSSIFLQYLILHSRLFLSLQGAFFPPALSTKILHAFLFSSMRPTCPVSLIYIDFIKRITFGEE
jgi:hypothetical protein